MKELHSNISHDVIDNCQLNIVGVVLIMLSINRRHSTRGKVCYDTIASSANIRYLPSTYLYQFQFTRYAAKY